MNDELRALSRRTGERLLRANWRLASAESCTGGLIGHALTEIAGSSAYYQGGVIAYDNAVKEHVLGVDPATLATVGAVSEACAKEMVAGVRRLLHTAVGVATTGHARRRALRTTYLCGRPLRHQAGDRATRPRTCRRAYEPNNA
jgi:nicotinamide-nucleotide amidase